jgi:ADP-ribose pyrophosphatase
MKKNMKDYFELLHNHPELVQNNDQLLRILLDPIEIAQWQVQRRSELAAKGQPLAWADIGIILDDPYFMVIRDLVEFPDGRLNGYSRVISQADLREGRGAVVLPVYQGKIMLLRQFRHATRQWHYEVPRGYGEPHLAAAVNARKEIEEETGGKIARLEDLGTFHNNTGLEGHPVSLFFAELASVGAQEKNEGIESFVWLSTGEIEQWIADGTITDGFTVAVYTKAKLRGLI